MHSDLVVIRWLFKERNYSRESHSSLFPWIQSTCVTVVDGSPFFSPPLTRCLFIQLLQTFPFFPSRIIFCTFLSSTTFASIKMFSKSNSGFLALFALVLTSESALGREQWLERDGTPVYLYPRRFGQEQPAVLQKIRAACTGGTCDTLAGQAVTPLLAGQPECSQQDMADAIIGGRQFLFT